MTGSGSASSDRMITQVEAKFLKSRLNHGTEASAHDFVLQDRRFQKPAVMLKTEILQRLGLREGSWTHRTFDLVMTDKPVPMLTPDTLDSHLGCLRLVEVKSTRDERIKDVRLNGFFYGSTKTQYDLAERAGERLVFVFVVLTDSNAYGKPFFVVLPFSEIQRRTRTKRVQYQVNFASNFEDRHGIEGPFPAVDFVV